MSRPIRNERERALRLLWREKLSPEQVAQKLGLPTSQIADWRRQTQESIAGEDRFWAYFCCSDMSSAAALSADEQWPWTVEISEATEDELMVLISMPLRTMRELGYSVDCAAYDRYENDDILPEGCEYAGFTVGPSPSLSDIRMHTFE